MSPHILPFFERPHPRPLSRFAGEGCLVVVVCFDLAVGSASIVLSLRDL